MKNNKKIIIIAIIIAIFLLLAGGYFTVTSMMPKNNKQNNENIINKDNEKKKEETKEENENEKSNLAFDISSMYNKYYDAMGKYKNSDNSYGYIKSETISSETHDCIIIDTNGNVSIYNGCNISSKQKQLDIKNVVDFDSCGVEISSDPNYYFLTSNGDVYKSNVLEYYNGNYNVSKVDGISSVFKLVNVHYGEFGPHGGSWELLAISKNTSIKLCSGSV